MTEQPDPVFAGLSAGLKPADLELPPDTITVDIELLRARERIRLVKATERLADLAEQALAAQLRMANAAERQAEALEGLAALFACAVEPVEGQDGTTRCTIRTHDRSPIPLSAYNT